MRQNPPPPGERRQLNRCAGMQEYGIYRLASRINDPKKRGYPIRKRTASSKNRYGEKVSFTEYCLGG